MFLKMQRLKHLLEDLSLCLKSPDSQRAGKREFHTYAGTAEYSIESMDENAKQLFRISLLIGAGPKPSFGFGFLNVIDPDFHTNVSVLAKP